MNTSKAKTLAITVTGIFIFILLIILPIGISNFVGSHKRDQTNQEDNKDYSTHASNASTAGTSELDHQISQVKSKGYSEHTIDASSAQTMIYPSDFLIPQLPGSLVTKVDGKSKVILETDDSNLNKTASFYRDWFESNGWSVRKDLIPAGFVPKAQLEYEKDGQIINVEVKSESGKDTVELISHK